MSAQPTAHAEPLNVYAGLASVMRALSHIPKGSSRGVNYEFRSIDDVMNALHGPLADAGLVLAVRVLDDWRLDPIAGTNSRTQYQAVFRVSVEVYAEDGSSVTLGPTLAQAHDYGDKAAYQAVQNAFKYLLLDAFVVPTGEPDMDGRHPDVSEEPAPGDAAAHAALLREVDSLVARLDVSDDPDRARRVRAYAEGSTANARSTVSRLRKELGEGAA